MDRHSELRRTGINPGKGFKPREKPIPRGGFTRNSPSLPRAPFRAGRGGGETPQRARRAVQLREWKELRELVLERDGHVCVRCGKPAGWERRLEVNHRHDRGQGGSRFGDHPANLVTLCGFGNLVNTELGWCHGHVHAHPSTHGAAGGWLLLTGEDPLETPVLYPDGRWYLLDDDGGRKPYEVAS